MSLEKPELERVHVAKMRLCLTCRRPFNSGWSGERVCGRCKSQDDWGEGEAYGMEYPSLLTGKSRFIVLPTYRLGRAKCREDAFSRP